MSSIVAREPLSWLVMIVKLDWSTIGCVFLMNFQKWVQLFLSSLPNNMANPSADMVPFALWLHTLNIVCISQSSRGLCLPVRLPAKKGTCFFDVDGETKIPIKNLY